MWSPGHNTTVQSRHPPHRLLHQKIMFSLSSLLDSWNCNETSHTLCDNCFVLRSFHLHDHHVPSPGGKSSDGRSKHIKNIRDEIFSTFESAQQKKFHFSPHKNDSNAQKYLIARCNAASAHGTHSRRGSEFYRIINTWKAARTKALTMQILHP